MSHKVFHQHVCPCIVLAHGMEIGEIMNLTTSYEYAPCPSVILVTTLTETTVATPTTTNFEPKRDHEVDIIVDNK